MADKVVREGKVAVLVSGGFGAGWSSWNGDTPECTTHPDIVAMVEREAPASEIEMRAVALWPDGYWGGAEGLYIAWVPEGTRYKIDEYDGSESIELEASVAEWRVA